MNNIRMSSISPKLTSGNNNNRYKLNKCKVSLIVALVSVEALTALLGFKLGRNSVKTPVPIFPQEEVVLLIAENVKPGETLDSITNKYYSDENASFFESRENYKNVIQSQNEIKYPDNIEAGQTLNIPVFVSINNSCYLQMKQIENELNDVIANEKWVDYTVKYGDTFEKLAYLASVDLSEAASISLEIQQRNKDHFPSGKAYLLQVGDTIKIINPRIGELKRNLASATEALKESITISSQQKGFTS